MTRLSTTRSDRFATDLLLVPVAAGALANSAAVAALDRALGGRLLAEARRAGFRGEREQDLVYQTHGAVRPAVVVLIGLGASPGIGAWYGVAEAVTRLAGRTAARRAAVALDRQATPAVVHALSEGVALARYRFDRYRTKPQEVPPANLTLLVGRVDAELRRAAAHAAVYARATALARDLANTPAADLAPLDLARAARRLAGPGLQVRVHDRRALARLQMGAILGVGRGSQQPPCLIELTYRPRGRVRRRVALVGKGITFDSGGLSIKTADSMQLQKRDMAGGAIVLAVLSALPALRLPIEVRGYVPAAENMPSGSAMRPGDVLRACNGTTIEVLNTDAEGRLVLADALAYAARRRPELILDFATLTAVVRTALGPRCAAILGTDRGLVDALLGAAATTDEILWELPLIGAYRRDIDSRVADLKNVGEGSAGTIVAALFLREFVAGVPWAHIDFSSTVMSDGYACHPKGASGYAVRTVLRWLTRLADASQSSRPPTKRRAQAAEQKNRS
jgi:leucyl aminopeptidase